MGAKTKSTADLGFLGMETQVKIVKGLIEDETFFRKVLRSLNPNSFTEPILRQISGIAKDYYEETGKIATYSDLDIILRNKAKTDIELTENVEYLKSLKSEKYLDGIDSAKEAAETFFKQQEMVKVLQKGIDNLTKNGFTNLSIQHVQESLGKIGQADIDLSMGVSPMDIFDEVLTRNIDEKVKTGVAEIDRAMNGGLPKKSLGLLVAKTGAGKTSLGTIFCAGAAECGFKVIQIFFEEDVDDIAAKHYAYHTGAYTSTINTTADKVALFNKIKENDAKYHGMKDNTILKRMPNGSTTPEDIRNYLKHMIANGFKPDMVFIDYFSCIQTSSDRRIMYGNEWKAAEMAMKKFEQMAYDLDIALWIAEQTNREALAKNTAYDRMGTIQGSFRITQPASFFFYLERGETRDDYNSANLYMDKCRGCSPCEWKNICLNNGNLSISFDGCMDNKNLPWNNDNNSFNAIIDENL